jgi:hypothetical protein
MGFTPQAAGQAVAMHNGDFDGALNQLLAGGT